MRGRLYVRCPHCEAEEPWRGEAGGALPEAAGPGPTLAGDRSQQCSVCGIDVVVSEANTFHRS